MSTLNRRFHSGGKHRRWALFAAFLLILLCLDAYAIHRVFVRRMGNALDYYPFWAGGREVLLHERSPYDAGVMLDIQQAIYGRPALPDENQHGYAYPAYAPLIVFPFLALPFPVSASLWIAFQQFLLVAAVVLAVRAGHWQIGTWRLLLLCLAAMTFRYAMIAFVLGQMSTWTLFCLSLALWAATGRRVGLAGLALAAGLVKPQLVLLPALALLIGLEPGRRARLVLSLGGAVAVLLAGSWVLAGFWIDDYWRLIQAYQAYSTTEFPVLALAQMWLSSEASRMLNVAAIGGLLALYAAVVWHYRGSGRVAFPVVMAVAITQLLVPQTGSYNLTLLLLPSVVALRRLDREQVRRHWITLVGRALVWASLVIVPWALFPLVTSPMAIPIDTIILPLLILLALLASLSARR
jgi:hypothetical protein